ncbi:MAG: hypothetical protein HQL18_01555 [Candidatus Omnitrophica bacterium]|nr:hypothetical protein [Candidatus Omnitrophota bacterium]
MKRKLFIPMAVVYGAAVLLVAVFFNKTQAIVQRLNTLQILANYPANLIAGRQPFDEGRMRSALRYYVLLSEWFPDMPRAYEMRGLCRMLLGNEAEAGRLFDQAFRKEKSFFWLSYEEGVALYHQARWKEAAAKFRAVLSDDLKQQRFNAVLSPLRTFSAPAREKLLEMIPEWVSRIRRDSAWMLVRSLARGGDEAGALKVLKSNGDFFEGDRDQILLYGMALSYDTGNSHDALASAEMLWSSETNRPLVHDMVDFIKTQESGKTKHRERMIDREEFRKGFAINITADTIHPWTLCLSPGKEKLL